MIEKLTDEQEKYLPIFRQKYLDYACNGKRIDRENLQAALNDAYAEIGKPAPLLIILQSPLQAMAAIEFMKKFPAGNLGEELNSKVQIEMGAKLDDKLSDQLRAQLFNQLRDQLFNQLGNQLLNQLGNQLLNQLEDQLRAKLEDQLAAQLGAYLRAHLAAQLGAQLGSQLWVRLRVQILGHIERHLRDQLRDQLWDQLWDQKIYDANYLWGSQDLFWIAWAQFGQHIGVKFNEKESRQLDIMERIAIECEWWWPYEGICFVSEKPVEVNWDDRVLHGEDKPAVLYEDGYAVYSWRGTNVPKEWIEGKTSLTPEMAITWENVEQRRCIAEILGWHNILKDERLNARTINKDSDPLIGELLEVDLPDVGTERFLKVECGTGRDFALPVPPDTNTALDAQAWLNFCTPEDILNLEVRT